MLKNVRVEATGVTIMELSKLRPAPGSKRKRTRLGIGEGSGHGKTSGRGGKGQTARTGGGTRIGFEGGQMPFNRRLPKYGFISQNKLAGHNLYSIVNLSDLEKFPEGAVVDIAALRAKGLVKDVRVTAGVKVLAGGQLSKKLALKVTTISKSAREKIEKAGGSVELVKN